MSATTPSRSARPAIVPRLAFALWPRFALRLAFALEVWDAATGARVWQWHAPADQAIDAAPPRWTADGSELLARASLVSSVNSEGRVYAWHVGTWAQRGPWRASAFAVARDGRTLFTSEPRRLRRVDVASGAMRPLLEDRSEEGGHYTYRGLEVSADGRWLTGVMHMMSGVAFESFDARDGRHAPWR